MRRLFYALIGTAVCAGAALALSGGVLLATKRDRNLQRAAERWLLAPGRLAAERLAGSGIREKAAEGLDKLQDTKLAQEVLESRAAERLGELAHFWNVGLWTAAGFLVCLFGAFVFGVQSISAAVSLGFKVMLTLFFAQAALVMFGASLLLKRFNG